MRDPAALTPEQWLRLMRANGDFVLPPTEKWGDDDPSDGGSISRLGMAALCLHGRITWEMVDAIRNAARIAGVDGEPDEGRYLHEIADLLESLLPPRKP